MNEQCLCHSRSNSNMWRRPQSSYQRTVVECPTLGPLVRSCLVRGMLLVYIRLWQQRQWEMYGLWLVPSRTLKGSCIPGSADTLLPPSLPVVFRFLPWCVVLRSSVGRSAPCAVRCSRGRLLFAVFFSLALLARFRARLLEFWWKECPKLTVKERNAVQKRKVSRGSLGTQDPEGCPHVDGHQPENWLRVFRYLLQLAGSTLRAYSARAVGYQLAAESYTVLVWHCYFWSFLCLFCRLSVSD